MLTFDTLASASKKDLDRLMDTGSAPRFDQVLGYEFRGWNLNASTKASGTRKFKKGFFGVPLGDYTWGYNVTVKQNRYEEPWIATPSEEKPKRHYFFKVYPATPKSRYPNSLVVDYRASGEYSSFNPIGYTVDYLVFVDPANTDLILGKSYLEVGGVKPFLGYFVLERHNASYYERVPAPAT